MFGLEQIKYYTEPLNKYNVFSVSIFRLKNPYKSTKTYYDGLKLLIDIFKKNFPHFYLRIYYDKSISTEMHETKEINEEIRTMWQPLLKNARKKDFIQLIEFRHPLFLTKDGYHIGLFGTLTRMIPLFDYEENKKINIVAISDVDIRYYATQNYVSYIKYLLKSTAKFFFRTLYCTEMTNRLKSSKIYVDKYIHIYAGTMISKIKFDRSIMDDFMKACLDNISGKMYDKKDDLMIRQFKSNREIDKKDIELGCFYYGIDEIFVIKIFAQLINRKIPFSYVIGVNMRNPLFQYYSTTNDFKINPKRNRNLIKTIMGETFDDKLSTHDNYFILDNIIDVKNMHQPTANKQRVYIIKNIYKVMEKLKIGGKYKRFGMEKIFIDCILEHKTFDEPIILDYIHK